ncbi:hypothetical protein [Georgenia ruanii]|uniref:hypothetical protein n=1 Tax=Georgenia ruanii TaxID=348442 RepID=UPI001264D8F6|nr:hypothetical protein [Georgenia ruanii]
MILDSWVEAPGQERTDVNSVVRALHRGMPGCRVIEVEESSAQTCVWAAVVYSGPGPLPLCLGLFVERTFVPADGDSSLLPADSGQGLNIVVFASENPWDPESAYPVRPGGAPRVAAAWLREVGLADLPTDSEQRRVAAALLPGVVKPQLALLWAEATTTDLAALPEEWIQSLHERTGG